MKSLILNGPMVGAWMEGEKTVTRRLIKPQPPNSAPNRIQCHDLDDGKYGFFDDQDNEYHVPYLPGETVYIRETWAIATDFGYSTDHIFYKASYVNGGIYDDVKKWRPSIHLREEDARSHALIKSVRAERVQDITDTEIDREGIEVMFNVGMAAPATAHIDIKGVRHHSTARECFRILWESIYPGSWERNDFVFRYELGKV